MLCWSVHWVDLRYANWIEHVAAVVLLVIENAAEVEVVVSLALLWDRTVAWYSVPSILRIQEWLASDRYSLVGEWRWQRRLLLSLLEWRDESLADILILRFNLVSCCWWKNFLLIHSLRFDLFSFLLIVYHIRLSLMYSWCFWRSSAPQQCRKRSHFGNLWLWLCYLRFGSDVCEGEATHWACLNCSASWVCWMLATDLNINYFRKYSAISRCDRNSLSCS